MTYDYSRLANTALRLIAKYGRSVTLRSVTAGTYDPATRTKSGASTSDATVSMAFNNYTQNQIDGEVIRRDDLEGLLAASGLTTAPENGDIVIDGSNQYKIVNVDVIQPGDTVIVYKLQLRS